MLYKLRTIYEIFVKKQTAGPKIDPAVQIFRNQRLRRPPR